MSRVVAHVIVTRKICTHNINHKDGVDFGNHHYHYRDYYFRMEIAPDSRGKRKLFRAKRVCARFRDAFRKSDALQYVSMIRRFDDSTIRRFDESFFE